MTTRILDIMMAAGAALAVLLGSFGAFARECDEIPQEVLRLHIPANSDSEYDQAVKLKVRDYILEEYGAQLSGCGSREEAVEEVRRLLPDIENPAANIFRSRERITAPGRSLRRCTLPQGNTRTSRCLPGITSRCVSPWAAARGTTGGA